MPRKSAKALRSDARLVNLLRGAIDAGSDDSAWAHLGEIGNYIANQAPDFDPRNYGFKKLSNLVEGIGLFEVKRQGGSRIVVRDPKAK